MAHPSFKISNEIGELRKVAIHSPDGGIGKVIPSKAQEWLYEDIVDLGAMQREYDEFKKTLLLFLDPSVYHQWLQKEASDSKRSYSKPSSTHFLNSSQVLELQDLLSQILDQEAVRRELIASVCAIEKKSFKVQSYLSNPYHLNSKTLAKLLIAGALSAEELPHFPEKKASSQEIIFIFPPIPNFIFTRDLGILIGNHLLLTQTAALTRNRENLLMRYLTYYNLLKDSPDLILEIVDDDEVFLAEETIPPRNGITLEGGDIMMIHSNHLLIGCSERTSSSAIRKIIHTLFEKQDLGLEKISVVLIPRKRSSMHIDTLFTQVSRSTWVVHTPLSRAFLQSKQIAYFDGILKFDDRFEREPVRIVQFTNQMEKDGEYKILNQMSDLESLLIQISVEDFKCHPNEVQFIYSGNGKFPFSDREQWTDSCNVVAVREGIVLGYDRNEKTIEGFAEHGFQIVDAKKLHKDFRLKNLSLESLKEERDKTFNRPTILLLPSSELSRARGGSHCMTLPLERASI